MNIHLFLGWKILNGLENGTIDLAIPDFLTFASKPYQALAISSSVSLSEYEDIPTFAQIGLEIDSYALVFGITVSPQTSESLRQEISNAFSNITMNPNFTSQINNLGASVLIGYNYGSSNLNNFINHEISILEQALGLAGSSTQQQITVIIKPNTLAIILGVIVPIFVILVLILIIVAVYLKVRSKTQLQVFDLNSLTLHEIAKRGALEAVAVPWNSITDLKEFGSGS